MLHINSQLKQGRDEQSRNSLTAKDTVKVNLQHPPIPNSALLLSSGLSQESPALKTVVRNISFIQGSEDPVLEQSSNKQAQSANY